MKRIVTVLVIMLVLLSLVSCDCFGAGEHSEHTFRYVAYDTGHFKEFTCGCPSPEIMGMHYDDNYDGACDACGHPMQNEPDECPYEWEFTQKGHYKVMLCECHGVTGVFDPHEDLDADLKCDVCGYRFDSPNPTGDFLRNQAGCEWLNEISAEDIAEIKITSEAVGVAPGSLKNIHSSTDEAVMARLFEVIYWLDIWPIPQEEGEIDGGGAVTIRFILKDGTTKELYINNGNYRDTNGNYFELLFIPGFEDGDKLTKYNGFVTYIDTGAVYTAEPHSPDDPPVCIINGIGELEFFEPEGFPECDATHYILTEFGNLTIYSNTSFMYDGGCYQLVNGDFYAMFENSDTAEQPE